MVSVNYVGLLLVVCLALSFVTGQNSQKVGKPQFSLEAAGGGKNLRNFNAGFNAGVGTKVWESRKKDKSLELGVNYGRGYARVDGHTFKSKPQYGIGATFRFRGK